MRWSEQRLLWGIDSGDHGHYSASWALCVTNQLDPIEELYDMYSEEEDTPRIVELGNDGLDLVLDIEGPADPYMDL